MPNADAWTIYQVIPLSSANGVQLAYETNNAILGMRSWNYNGKFEFTSWVQFADDSKVAHLSGANNFDTVPTVNNNPLLLASSLPSDLARTGQDQEFTGKNTFDTAPIDKKTGNPYITKDGIPAISPTLADTTKDANFTGKLQKSGIDVATTADVDKAVNAITSKSINWTSLSVDSSQTSDTDYISNQTNCSYRISHNTLYVSGQYIMGGNSDSSHNSNILFKLPTSIVSQISFPSTNKFTIGLLQAMAQQATMFSVNLTSDGKITCTTNPHDLNTISSASMAPGFINAAIPLN